MCNKIKLDHLLISTNASPTSHAYTQRHYNFKKGSYSKNDSEIGKNLSISL